MKYENIKLDLGCGKNKKDNYIGIDIREYKGVDIVHDTETFPYPLPDGCCKEILASHLLEHINPKVFIDLMNECWRIANNGCEFKISVPYAGSKRYWQDPTHCNGIIEETLHYFDPRFSLYKIYEPKPWAIKQMNRNELGDLEIILIKGDVAVRGDVAKEPVETIVTKKNDILFCIDDIGIDYLKDIEKVEKLKKKYPQLKVNVFTVAKDIDNSLIEWLKQDWIEVNVHAYDHSSPPEPECDDREVRVEKALNILRDLLPEKYGYRFPGWRTQATMIPFLKELGFSYIAHQNKIQLLNEKRVINNILIINTHIYEDLNYEFNNDVNFKFITEII